jgi:hypothetical protein
MRKVLESGHFLNREVKRKVNGMVNRVFPQRDFWAVRCRPAESWLDELS